MKNDTQTLLGLAEPAQTACQRTNGRHQQPLRRTALGNTSRVAGGASNAAAEVVNGLSTSGALAASGVDDAIASAVASSSKVAGKALTTAAPAVSKWGKPSK